VPQYPYFGFQPPPRPEAVVQQPDEKQANCDHQPQSCSDSVAAAIPTDGVFGSDTYLQSLIDTVEVDDHHIRIGGSKEVLERAVLAGQTASEPGSQMSTRWRARRDSNS